MTTEIFESVIVKNHKIGSHMQMASPDNLMLITKYKFGSSCPATTEIFESAIVKNHKIGSHMQWLPTT